MPKSKGGKYPYYATQNGREGPKIYTLWSECHKNVDRVKGVKYKGCNTFEEAQKYIAPTLARAARLQAIKSALNTAAPKVNAPDVALDTCAIEGTEVCIARAMDVKVVDKNDGSVNVVQETHFVAEEASGIQVTSVVDNVDMKCCDCCDTTSAQSKEVEILPSVSLSDEQLKIFYLVKKGKNVFFTGSAGTGKSVLMRAIIGLWPPGCRRLAITASTGAASVHFPGGRTLHSWAGIGLGTKDADRLYDDIMQSKTKREAWLQTDCLLIDEISMIDDELFDKVDYLGKRIRQNDEPFGGIQLVVSGDFFQLPPVVNASKIKAKFAFEGRAWETCFDKIHKLTIVFRQRDADFVQMLEEIKIAQVSRRTAAEFAYLARPVKYYDGIGPTELYSTNEEAALVNQTRLDDIDEPEMVFSSHDVSGVDLNDQRISRDRYREVLKGISAPSEVVLKVGARVMLIMNKIQGKLINGSNGVVEGFQTIDEAEANHIMPFHETDKDALQRARDALPTIVRDPRSNWKGYRYPVQENRFGHLMAGRTQIPLILCWAISIHKSQGSSLERVKVDLSRTFERGQVYVALSRATSLDTLQVLGFDASKVEAHPHVLEFMGLEADKRDLEEENNRRALAEKEYDRAMERSHAEDDYFSFVDDIDEIDIHLMDSEHIPI